MKDGANQELEVGKFCIYTGQKTAQFSIGFIVGFTAKSVKVLETYSYQNKPINKTPERIIQINDEMALSMNEEFFQKMRNGINI